MSKTQDKIPPTTTQEQPQEQPQLVVAPVEIVFHVAGTHIEKFETPEGTLTSLSLLSPTGFAVTVKMDDENADQLANELRSEKSNIVLASVLPPGLRE